MFLGTTWLQEIVWLLQNQECNSEVKDMSVWERVPILEMKVPGSADKVCIDQVEAMESPRLYKCHLPLRFVQKQLDEAQCKHIVIQRNPKDLLVSYFHFFKLIYPSVKIDWSTFFEGFRSKTLHFGDWFEHVKTWYTKKNNIMFITYEEMKQNHRSSTEKIAKFLDISATDEVIDSIVKRTTFKNMKSDPALNLNTYALFENRDGGGFMRKGQVGDWKNYFTEEQNDFMNQRIKEELPEAGLKFIYEENQPAI